MLLSIPILEDEKCLLKTGQKVEFGTPFLEKKTLADSIISVNKRLSIAPDKIFKYLKKFVGEPVAKGEVIAVKQGVFLTRKVICDKDGVIKEVNHNEGTVIVTISESAKKTVKAYFVGEVDEVKKNELKIKVKEGKEFDLKNASQDFGGEIFAYKQGDDLLASQVKNKILIAEKIDSFYQIKGEALGIKGFVTLIKLSDNTKLPTAQIKNIDDFKTIAKHNFSYCLINKQSCKMFIYK